MSRRNKMIAACKLEQTEDPFPFWRNTQEIVPAQYPNYRPRLRKPHSLFFISPQRLTHGNTENTHSQHISPSHPENPERGILTEDGFTSVSVCVFVGVCVCVCVCVLQVVTAPHTWSCEGGWLSGPRCPDCSSQCLPSPHAEKMERQRNTQMIKEPPQQNQQWWNLIAKFK